VEKDNKFWEGDVCWLAVKDNFDVLVDGICEDKALCVACGTASVRRIFTGIGGGTEIGVVYATVVDGKGVVVDGRGGYGVVAVD